MDSSNRTRMSTFLGGFLLTMSQAGNAVTVSEMPLFISTGVTPNVMLVVDNSGSHEQHHLGQGLRPYRGVPGLEPHPDLWAGRCNGGTNFDEGWTSLTGIDHSLHPGNSAVPGYLRRCAVTPVTCAAANDSRGVSADGLTTKCLTLPDPVGGGNTRYTG